jgi:hypothetical protein
MSHPNLSADGTITFDAFIGRNYTFGFAGDFGGGSLAVNFVLDGVAAPFPNSPLNGPGTFTAVAPGSQIQLVLSGSTDPDIEFSIAPVNSETPEAIGAITPAGMATLTNKRIPPRITTITSSATPTVNTDDCDMVTITALAAAISSMTSGLTGTPNNGEMLLYRIKDDGTARAITWGASFAAAGAALPTTTVLGKVLHVLFIWDSVAAKWCCLSNAQEA